MSINNFNRSIITKRIIDLASGFLKEYIAHSRLYQNTEVTDQMPLVPAQVPLIVINGTTNNQRRIHFDDFIQDAYGKVKLIPIAADDTLFGNNEVQVNLAATVSYDPRWPWDPTTGYPSGTDITNTVYQSAPFNSGVSTGIIVTIPPASTYNPTSISTAVTYGGVNSTWSITGTNTYNVAVSLNQANDQYYLAFSGNDITGTFVPPYINMGTGVVGIPVDVNQIIVDGSGIAAGLSGTQISLSDVLYAGDQYQIQTYPNNQFLYEIYGGIYDISMTFNCFHRTTLEAEELGDLVERIMVEKKLHFFDRYGVSFTSWSQGALANREYVNNHIFQSSVTVQGFVEWHDFRMLPLITSVSGNAIPTGIYWDINPSFGTPGGFSPNMYQAPGVYALKGTDPIVPGYFGSETGFSGSGILPFQLQ